jgi:hypothetical protein
MPGVDGGQDPRDSGGRACHDLSPGRTWPNPLPGGEQDLAHQAEVAVVDEVPAHDLVCRGPHRYRGFGPGVLGAPPGARHRGRRMLSPCSLWMRYGRPGGTASLAALSFTPASLPLGVPLLASIRSLVLATCRSERFCPGRRSAGLGAVAVSPIAREADPDDALAVEAPEHPVEPPFGRRRESAEAHPASSSDVHCEEPEPRAVLRRAELEPGQTAGITRIVTAVYTR